MKHRHSASHPFRIYTVNNDPEVRELSVPFVVENIHTPDSQQFFDDLINAMLDFDGIGIAAVQVGKLTQVFVVHKDYVDSEYAVDDSHLVLINPRMVSKSSRMILRDEGCLSVPGTFGPAERASKLRMKAYRRDGSQVDIKAKGLFAWVLQHEYDHLHGSLFIDIATELHEAGSSM